MNSIWVTLFSLIGAIALYAIIAVIWFIRLEGKVKTNEQLFKQFQDHSKRKDDKIENSINQLYDLVRKVDSIANNLKGRMHVDDKASNDTM
jgi:hypothetical protein